MTTITQNGVFPAGSLAETYLYYPDTANGRKIRADIAPYAEALATAFLLRFGKPLYATDGARDLATQKLLYAQKPALAAPPGTSNHGWARAFDLSSGIATRGSEEHRWLLANEGKYGFAAPEWANNPNHPLYKNEPWHHEFVGGGSKARRILRPRTGRGETGLGDSGDKVREIQQLVNDRLSGPDIAVDGGFGLGTAAAVFKFQDQRGLTPTGRVSQATLNLLRGGEASTPPPATGGGTGLPGAPTTAERVRALQRAIRTGKITGAWGPDTDRRVAALSAASAFGGRQFPEGVKLAQNVVGAEMDGVWGPASEAKHTETVKAVQRAVGVEDDGVYGRGTSGALSILRGKAKK